MKKKANAAALCLQPATSVRRQLCNALGLGALLASAPTLARGLAVKIPTVLPWRLLVNEAVTGDTNIVLLTSRYQPLADFVTQHSKGRQIGIEPVVNIQRFMSLAQGATKPDLVFGK